MNCLSPQDITEGLNQPVRLKTWSLIVTIFGDAILPHGGSVAAQTLNEITSAMGINPGAVRTALSRLASDGIIERTRDGRNSTYRLSPAREKEFIGAADRIYARPDRQRGQSGHALVASPAGQFAGTGAIRLSREWWMVEQAAITDLPAECAVFEGSFSNLPEWMISRVASPDAAAAMNQLLEVFSPLLSTSRAKAPEDGLQALAERCLLIHAWRRIALRLQPLPEGFVPADWPEDRCRRLVADLYRQLQPASEHWLQEMLGSAASDAARRRFL